MMVAKGFQLEIRERPGKARDTRDENWHPGMLGTQINAPSKPSCREDEGVPLSVLATTEPRPTGPGTGCQVLEAQHR